MSTTCRVAFAPENDVPYFYLETLGNVLDLASDSGADRNLVENLLAGGHTVKFSTHDDDGTPVIVTVRP